MADPTSQTSVDTSPPTPAAGQTPQPVWASTLPATETCHDQEPPRPLLPLPMQSVVALSTAAGLLTLAAWLGFFAAFSGGVVSYDTLSHGPGGANTGYTVDLNTATRAELLQLPRVGPALADRILTRRQTVGPFTTLNDLREIPGIGEVTLQGLTPFLRPLAPPPPSTTSAGQPSDDLRTGQ